jgi:hypothetical protein
MICTRACPDGLAACSKVFGRSVYPLEADLALPGSGRLPSNISLKVIISLSSLLRSIGVRELGKVRQTISVTGFLVRVSVVASEGMRFAWTVIVVAEGSRKGDSAVRAAAPVMLDHSVIGKKQTPQKGS